MSSIVVSPDLPACENSRFARAQFYWRRFLCPVPIDPVSLRAIPNEEPWIRQRPDLNVLTNIFGKGHFEVGLSLSAGVVVIEASLPISGWRHDTIGVPFGATERSGLVRSYYKHDGRRFDNPLHPALEYPIRVHQSGYVPVPDTPEPGRKNLFVRDVGAHFDSTLMPILVKESADWRRAKREAQAIHRGGANR